MTWWRTLLVALAASALFVALPVRAGEAPSASFALIIGSNVSVDTDLSPLRYADDDAARYFDLFRLLGMRTILLSRIDESTRKLHPQAAAEAQLPRRIEYLKAVMQLSAEVAEARRRGLKTVVYFVFAGHGGVDGANGYVSLEDARLTGAALGTEVVSRVAADSIHMILDACNSYLVAYSRGPGGVRHPVQDFAHSVYELGRDPRVGLLLSTSSATESHEWDAFQGGIFSHEIRSGLYGAADADGDGAVSYREIAAFVARANASIDNARFRPTLFARAPLGEARDQLIDLSAARARRKLTVDGSHAGRYLLEDARGVRLADFHSARGQEVILVRPAPTGPAYLRSVDDLREYVLPPGDEALEIAQLAPNAPRVASRGALHESFSRLFLLPFDRAAVASYTPEKLDERREPEVRAKPSGRLAVGLGMLGVGLAGVGVGTFYAVRAGSEPDSGPADSQRDVAARNAKVSTWNTAAAACFIAGGVIAAAGVIVLAWPSGSSSGATARTSVQFSASDHGAFAGFRSSF
jgi:hypothetical protein